MVFYSTVRTEEDEIMSEEKINIGMVGGGLQSFMGPIHRMAIEKAGLLRLASGCFGATKQSSLDCAKACGVDEGHAWGAYREFIRHEAKLPPEQRLLFISTVLPNTMHYPVAMLAMDCGVPILGEKPFTTNLDEAANLMRKHRTTGVPYRIAMVYPAYSMLVKARDMLRKGAIGTLRRYVFSMQSGWMARRIENQGNRQALWRVDSHRNGAGGVVNDSGCHCQFVLEWLTGFEITEVCALARPCVPGRIIADDATVYVRTREGIDGTFLLSQVATGHREGLAFEITGDKGAMIWKQSEPGKLLVVSNDGAEKVYADATASGQSARAEEPFGANEAYIEALSRVYREFAESLQGRKRKVRAKDSRILGMTIEEGFRSVCVSAAMEKSFVAPPTTFTQSGMPNPPPPPPPKWIPVTIPNTDPV